jgi:hypothetical protein
MKEMEPLRQQAMAMAAAAGRAEQLERLCRELQKQNAEVRLRTAVVVVVVGTAPVLFLSLCSLALRVRAAASGTQGRASGGSGC